MAFLSGKRILITGVISNRSIAYGIAQACREQGAEIALTYAADGFKSRIEGLAESLGAEVLLPLDVTDDEQIDDLKAQMEQHWGGLDGVVDSNGFATREAVGGEFLAGLSHEPLTIAH